MSDGNASGYQHNRTWWSGRMRVVILTFESPEAAEAWDAAGQPLGTFPHVAPNDIVVLRESP